MKNQATVSQTSTLGVFRHRNYTLLWLGQLASNLGDSFHSLAMIWLVKELTGSSLLIGTIMAAFTLPLILVSPLAGVLADRVDKRRLMIISDLARAVLVTTVAVLYSLHALPFGLIVILAVALGAATAFFEPARQGSLALLVNPDELTQANSFAMLTRQISQLAGPILAGIMVAVWGIAPAFWADAASFVISVLALGFMRYASPLEGGAASVQRLWLDMNEGFKTMGRHPLLRWVAPLSVVVNFLLAPIPVLLASYVGTISRQGAAALGYLQSADGAGMLLGSILIGTAGTKWHKGPAVIIGFAGMGLSVIGFGLVPSLAPAIAVFLLAGLFSVLVNVPALTLIQQETPVEQQGRIFSALMAAGTAAQPISMAAGGALGDRFGVHAVYLGMGILLSILAAGLSLVKTFREAR